MSSEDLVTLLSSDDGWYRDMAQRLLVERNDKEVIQSIKSLAQKGDKPLGRFHALWTLEGLHALTGDILFTALEDSDPLVASTAVRLLEPMAAGDPSVRKRLQDIVFRKGDQPPMPIVLQLALTAGAFERSTSHELLLRIATAYDTSALMRDAILSSIADGEFAFMQKLLALREWKEQTQSREIFLEMLTSSIVRKRDPRELRSLLAMLNVDSKAFGWREQTILTGMSIQGYGGKIKPLKLQAEPAVLKRQDLKITESERQGLASLFEWPGSISRDSLAQGGVVLNDRQKEQFALGRQLYLSSCSGCHGNDGNGLNRFAPPLRGSEWVLGDSSRLALIVLHGIEGPLEVAGKRYAEPEILPVMPGHSTLDDRTLAAILTYIRNEWGNRAGAVRSRTVGTLRLTHQGRVLPWTAEELNEHMKEISNQ
jgi:mono/diheme cytochrome c family protein